MPPQQPQSHQDPNQYQPTQPQSGVPQAAQPPTFEGPAAPISPSSTPSSWNTLFIVSLVLAVLLPLVGLIIGEVQFRKAKAAGNDIWRKKWKLVINLGAVMILVFFLGRLGLAFYNSRPGLPTKDEAINYTNTIDLGFNSYFVHLHTVDSQGNSLVSFPTLAQLNDPSWRQTNGIKFDQLIISTGDQATISFISGTPTKRNQYGYVPTPTGCQNTAASPCTGYSLTAMTTSGIYTDTITPKDYQ